MFFGKQSEKTLYGVGWNSNTPSNGEERRYRVVEENTSRERCLRGTRCAMGEDDRTKQIRSTSKRVRREIRDLTAKEWGRVVDALWIMKETPKSKGEKLYGDNFRSYDELVRKHMKMSLNPKGDMAHFVPSFPFFHRFWILEVEMSLLSIDSRIEALPFWDPNRKESVFTEKYMGSAVGDSEQGYIVTDGKFKYWPIQRDKSDSNHAYTNAFHFLRSPLSVNNAPYLTRNAGSMCGRTMRLTTKKDFKRCATLDEKDIHVWMNCADDTLHGAPHVAIGGSWRRQAQERRSDYEDSRLCTQWYSFLGSPFSDDDDELQSITPLGNYIHPYSAGCFQVQTCKLSQRPDDCMPQIIANKRLCGPLWSNLPDEDWSKVKLVAAKHIHNIGDFSCSVASPNDPLFIFHHANVDRNFESWLQHIRKSLKRDDYLNYPRNGYISGTNLNDKFFKNEFKRLFRQYFGGNGKLTFADVIDHCQKGEKLDYIYDKKYNVDTSRDWYRHLSRSSSSDAGRLYSTSSYDLVTIYIIIAIAVMMFFRIVTTMIIVYSDNRRAQRLRQRRRAATSIGNSDDQPQDVQHQFQMTHVLSQSSESADRGAQMQVDDFKEVYPPIHTSNRLPLPPNVSGSQN